jgi:hypothetical protein
VEVPNQPAASARIAVSEQVAGSVRMVALVRTAASDRIEASDRMEDQPQVARRMLAPRSTMDSGIPSAAVAPQYAPAASPTRAFAAQAIPAASVRLAHPIPLPLRRGARPVSLARRDLRAQPRHMAVLISLIRTSAAADLLADLDSGPPVLPVLR